VVVSNIEVKVTYKSQNIQQTSRDVLTTVSLKKIKGSSSSSIYFSKQHITKKNQTTVQQNGTAEYCGTDRLFPALISDLNTMKAIK